MNCSLLGCHYRRTPAPVYTVNLKALKRWAGERLSMRRLEDGGIEARFRYEGTTCTNMGCSLLFDYRVELDPAEDGYRIRDERCTPAPDDSGHRHMCRYIENPAALMTAIADEKPLLGQPLKAV